MGIPYIIHLRMVMLYNMLRGIEERSIVLAAVSNYGDADVPNYGDADVPNYGDALKYASEELKKDRSC